MAAAGLYVTLDRTTTGALRPSPPETGISPGDGSILVTDLNGTNDPTEVINLLNRGVAVPLPITGKFTVSLEAVKVAVAAGSGVLLSRLG